MNRGEKPMAKTSVKPKSRILYDTLRDEGLKKKKAAKIANGFVVSKRGDTSSLKAAPKRGSATRGKTRKKSSARKSTGKRSRTH